MHTKYNNEDVFYSFAIMSNMFVSSPSKEMKAFSSKFNTRVNIVSGTVRISLIYEEKKTWFNPFNY